MLKYKIWNHVRKQMSKPVSIESIASFGASSSGIKLGEKKLLEFYTSECSFLPFSGKLTTLKQEIYLSDIVVFRGENGIVNKGKVVMMKPLGCFAVETEKNIIPFTIAEVGEDGELIGIKSLVIENILGNVFIDKHLMKV